MGALLGIGLREFFLRLAVFNPNSAVGYDKPARAIKNVYKMRTVIGKS